MSSEPGASRKTESRRAASRERGRKSCSRTRRGGNLGQRGDEVSEPSGRVPQESQPAVHIHHYFQPQPPQQYVPAQPAYPHPNQPGPPPSGYPYFHSSPYQPNTAQLPYIQGSVQPFYGSTYPFQQPYGEPYPSQPGFGYTAHGPPPPALRTPVPSQPPQYSSETQQPRYQEKKPPGQRGRSEGPERGRRQNWKSDENLHQSSRDSKSTDRKYTRKGKKGRKPRSQEAEQQPEKTRDKKDKQEQPQNCDPKRSIPELSADQSIKIFNLLLKQFNGRAELGTFLSQKGDFFKDFSYEDIVGWLKRSDRFLIFEKNEQVRFVSIDIKNARTCFKYKKHNTDKCENENCRFFHICKEFIAGSCPWETGCHFNHSFHSKGNAKVCDVAGLQAFTDEEIRTIVLRSMPVVCSSFNKGGCHGDCPDLHVCSGYVRNDCFYEDCKFGHRIKGSEHNDWILETFHMQKIAENTLCKMVIGLRLGTAASAGNKPSPTPDGPAATNKKPQEDPDIEKTENKQHPLNNPNMMTLPTTAVAAAENAFAENATSSEITERQDDDESDEDAMSCCFCSTPSSPLSSDGFYPHQNDMTAFSQGHDLTVAEQGQDMPAPIFSATWQDSWTLLPKGGCFRKPGSDVILRVPTGAVMEDGVSKVYTAVCADVAHVRHLLELSDNEEILSPLAEYWVGQDFRFHSPVFIILPHFLPPDFNPYLVCVYHVTRCHDGQVSKTALIHTEQTCRQSHPRFKDDSNDCDNLDTGCFYLSAEVEVCISTNQFCGFVCTYCSKNSKKHPQLYALGSGSFSWNIRPGPQIKVSVHVWDARIQIADFREVYGIPSPSTDQKKCLALLHDVAGSRLFFRLRLLHQSSVTHCKDQTGQPMLKVEKCDDLPSKLRCEKCTRKGRILPICHEWLLEPQTGSSPVSCLNVTVDISHVTANVVPNWRYTELGEKLTELHFTVKDDIGPQTGGVADDMTRLRQQLTMMTTGQLELLAQRLNVNDSDICHLQHRFLQNEDFRNQILDKIQSENRNTEQILSALVSLVPNAPSTSQRTVPKQYPSGGEAVQGINGASANSFDVTDTVDCPRPANAAPQHPFKMTQLADAIRTNIATGVSVGGTHPPHPSGMDGTTGYWPTSLQLFGDPDTFYRYADGHGPAARDVRPHSGLESGGVRHTATERVKAAPRLEPHSRLSRTAETNNGSGASRDVMSHRHGASGQIKASGPSRDGSASSDPPASSYNHSVQGVHGGRRSASGFGSLSPDEGDSFVMLEENLPQGQTGRNHHTPVALLGQTHGHQLRLSSQTDLTPSQLDINVRQENSESPALSVRTNRSFVPTASWSAERHQDSCSMGSALIPANASSLSGSSTVCAPLNPSVVSFDFSVDMTSSPPDRTDPPSRPELPNSVQMMNLKY